MNEEAIFAEVIERKTPAERAAYLDQVCGDDWELRRRVEALLASHEQAGSFLREAAAQEFTLTHVTSPPSSGPAAWLAEGPGAVIGAYKLLECIGEGGFGVVYRAKQKHPVQRHVAIKIIKPGMDTAEVIARFESERQALALMDHENIARVLDGGATSSGRPFFVMELVKGRPITEYCDQHNLSPRERLELFTPVCRAVQHAHQKGIIHRDIKPSNVLVTNYEGQPVVKVIDFGVAKATNQRLTEKTLFTRQGQLVGTLQYMSPEQATLTGLDVDTRSDIYSLGVLLYELLTGTTPVDQQRLREAAFTEAQRIIRDEEPPKPSTRISESGATLASIAAHRRTEPRKLGRLLRGELDWIVMKALEKDRTRRYESANGFARDVERYLAHEPVEASPPSTAYRLRKFARKHRRLLATATSFVALLATAAVITSWLAVVAHRERADAVAARKRSDELKKSALRLADDAVRSSNRAKMLKHHAEAERQSAVRERERARKAYQRAERERARSVLAEQEEARQRSQAEDYLYFARIALASRARDDGDLRQAVDILAQCEPANGITDRRNWEWHFLHRLCHSELFDLDGHTNHAGETDAGGPVMKIAYSPDGRYLLSAGGGNVFFENPGQQVHGGEIIVHQADGGATWKVLRGHQHLVTAMDISDDGRHVASGSHDGVVKLWDLQTGAEAASWQAHEAGALSVAFLPGGRQLVSAGAGHFEPLKIWNTETGELVRALDQARAPIVVSRNGTRIASGGPLGVAKVWDRSGNLLHEIQAHARPLHDLAFSADGRLLASAGADGLAKLWDVESGQLRHILAGHKGSVDAVAFSPDDRRIATVGDDTTIRLWATDTGQTSGVFQGHEFALNDVSFDPTGTRIASAGHQGRIKVWDVTRHQSGLEIPNLTRHSHSLGALRFAPDSRELVTAASLPNGLGRMARWDAATGTLLDAQRFNMRSSLQWPRFDVSISPDSRFVAARSGNDASVLTIWNRLGWEVTSWDEGAGEIMAVEWSPDGRWLGWTARKDGHSHYEIRLADMAGDRQVHKIVADFPPPPDIVAGHPQEAALRRQQAKHPEDPEACNQLAWFLTTSANLFQGSSAEAVNLAQRAVQREPEKGAYWNTLGTAYYRDGAYDQAHTTLRKSLELNGENAYDLFFLAMTQLARGQPGDAADSYRRARDWMDNHARNASDLLRIRAEASRALRIDDSCSPAPPTVFVRALAFSSDNRLVAGSDPMTEAAWVWDLESGRPLHYLPTGRACSGLAFSPKGHLLAATVSGSQHVMVWDLRTRESVCTLTVPAGPSSVAFHPDGSRLAAANYRGDVRIWDTSRWHEVLLLRSFGPPPGTSGASPKVVFSPDGNRIAAFHIGAGVNLWDATPLTDQAIRANRENARRRQPAVIASMYLDQARDLFRSDPWAALTRFLQAAALDDGWETCRHAETYLRCCHRDADWERAAAAIVQNLPPDTLARPFVFARLHELRAKHLRRENRHAESDTYFVAADRQFKNLFARQSTQDFYAQAYATFLLERQAEFTHLVPTPGNSADDTEFHLQSDGSVFVQGEQLDDTKYDLRINELPAGITALRLEVLPDPRLAGGRAGRNPKTGKYGILEIAVAALGKEGAQPLSFPLSVSDADWNRNQTPRLMDADVTTAWSRASRHAERHQLWLLLDKPVDSKTAGLQITITFAARHQLGRFRMSATTRGDIDEIGAWLPTPPLDGSGQLVRLAAAQFFAGHPDLTLATLAGRGIEPSAASARPCLLYAAAHAERDADSEARRWLARAVRRIDHQVSDAPAPQDQRMLLQLARRVIRALPAHDKEDGAVKRFRKLVRSGQLENGWKHIDNARLAERKNDWDGAIEHWNAALRQLPEDLRLRWYRASACLSGGRAIEAADDLAVLYEHSRSGEFSPLAGHALVRLLVNDHQGYRQACSRLLDDFGTDRSDWRVASLLAICLVGDGVVTRQNRQLFQDMITTHVPLPWRDPAQQALLQTALACRTGRYTASVQHAKNSPPGPVALWHAAALAELGQPQQATAVLDQATATAFSGGPPWMSALLKDVVQHQIEEMRGGFHSGSPQH